MGESERAERPAAPDIGDRVRVRVADDCCAHRLGRGGSLLELLNNRVGVVIPVPDYVPEEIVEGFGVLGHPNAVKIWVEIDGESQAMITMAAADEMEVVGWGDDATPEQVIDGIEAIFSAQGLLVRRVG